MDPIQHLPQVDLSRVEKHHHRTRCADLIGEAQSKTALGQGNPAFQTRDSTSWKIKFGQDITKIVRTVSFIRLCRILTFPAANKSSRQSRKGLSKDHHSSVRIVSYSRVSNFSFPQKKKIKINK